MINYYLKQPPPTAILPLDQCRNFILDGTFLHRPRSLLALMDAASHKVVASKYPASERSVPQLTAFFDVLISEGLCPQSFTVDGNPKVMSVLRKLWPDAAIQRCLVHIQRQGLAWCRMSPKTGYARKLRSIFLQVPSIATIADRDKFLIAVTEWECKYGYLIDRKPETGRVFSDIKRARSMLLRALPNMFHYLNNRAIPISTNGLENYFSRLKTHYRQHRGLANIKRSNYFKWYVYYVPK
jgi:hypothetical protein